MNEVDLARLRELHVFDPAPSLEELYDFHVPFDELVGRGACEQDLRRALWRGEQVALVGDSGSGKSSVIGHVLGPLVEGVAPLPIPVSVERPEVAADPVEFAAHLVRTVARYVQHAMPAKAAQAKELASMATPETAGGTRRRRFGLGLGWLQAKLELAGELEQAVAPQPRSAREIIDQALAILRLIEASELRPILVFDDTDKWFGPAIESPDRLLESFFGRVVRLIAEDLGATAVLAVHHAYREHPAFRHAAGFISSTVQVPRIPSAEALGRLLAHRTKDVRAVEPEALSELFAYYNDAEASDIRQRVMLIAHTALAHACDAGASRIQARHVELAIAEYGDPGRWWRGFDMSRWRGRG